MAHDGCNYFSFWAILCPFTPLTAKNRIFWKMKKLLEISSFYTSVLKIMITCYTVPQITCMMGVIVIFHFGLFQKKNYPIYPFILITAWKIKIKKKRKYHLEISSFYTCVQKMIIRWCMIPEIWCTTDGWTDRWTDWKRDMLRWVLHLKTVGDFNVRFKSWREPHISQFRDDYKCQLLRRDSSCGSKN